MLSHQTFIEQVRDRGGFHSASSADAAICATLDALGACMTREEACTIAAELPQELGQILCRVHRAEELDDTAIYALVADQEGEPVQVALEHSQVVCQVLAEILSPETRNLLVRALPVELEDGIVPHMEEGEPLHHEPRREVPLAGYELAEPRPPTQHTVSQGVAIQPNSIVDTAEPYADRKLSSARPGPRPERTLAESQPGSQNPVSTVRPGVKPGRTLAEGRPGSKRPLSDAGRPAQSDRELGQSTPGAANSVDERGRARLRAT